MNNGAGKEFFTADWHIGHANILTLTNRSQPNIWTMEKEIKDNINAIVGANDWLNVLGDISYKCSVQHTVDFIRSLNCKLRILLGNHDKVLRKACLNGMLDDLVKAGRLEIIGGKMALEDHTLSVSKMMEIEGQRVFISHYSHRSWPHAFRKSIMLFGHSHHNLPNYFRSMDVGVDTFTETHQKFFPWSWEEIKTEMEKVKIEFKEKED